MIQTQILTENWELAQLPSNSASEVTTWLAGEEGGCHSLSSRCKWLAAEMPSQVHDVLLAHGKIRHPFEPGACKECAWISEEDWLYRTAFTMPDLVDTMRIYLHFHGLDTIVDIYLNGERIAAHRDMFLPLRIDVTGKLVSENDLLLHFRAPLKWIEAETDLCEFLEAGGKPRKAIRKGAEDFSFFNGAYPYFAPVGVYAPVTLETVKAIEVEYLGVDSEVSEDLGMATLRLQVEVQEHQSIEWSLRVRFLDPQGQCLIDRETSKDTESWSVPQPELWYPHTLGKQPLYRLEVSLLADGIEQEQLHRSIGLRRVERHGHFDFSINGLRLKLWGANLTPLPSPGHVHDEGMLTRLLNLAVQAHMPAMRVWGPSQPWPEQLYAEADRLGILLWVEFPYTGSGFPGKESYVDLCRAEARHVVRSFKHHASVLFWSGGNEAYLGLEGAEPPPDHPDRKLFDQALREVVMSIDPSRWYIPNSPHGGAYGNDPREGDSHIRDYMFFQTGDRYPVLASENTRLTVPLAKTLRRHFGEDMAWPEDGFTGDRRHFNEPVLPESWQQLTPNAYWSNVRPGYVGQLFESDGSPEGLLFRLGAGSALFIRETVERIRRGRPHWQAKKPRRCMGYQWWKLNDTFPMIYASLIDDQLEPNMAYYALRRAYAPVLVSAEVDNGAHFWVINDGPNDVTGELEVRLLNQTGTKTLKSESFPVQMAQGESRLVGNAENFNIIPTTHPLHLTLRNQNGQEQASALVYLTQEREIWYPEATALHLRQEGNEIVLSCQEIARWVELRGETADGDAFGWDFEDNFFDLVPGNEKRVRLLGKHISGTISARSRYAKDETTITFQL